MGGGASWHVACFNCHQCHKRLESTILCEREGEIYCKTCYGKHFGPKGYGYGVGSGTLQMSWDCACTRIRATLAALFQHIRSSVKPQGNKTFFTVCSYLMYPVGKQSWRPSLKLVRLVHISHNQQMNNTTSHQRETAANLKQSSLWLYSCCKDFVVLCSA